MNAEFEESVNANSLEEPQQDEPDTDAMNSVEVIDRSRNYFKYFPNISNCYLEVVAFLMCLATGALVVTVQNYYLKVICYNLYQGNESIQLNCFNLSLTVEQEVEVQTNAARYSTYRNIIESGIPAICSIFWFGDWCDRYGCKPLIILPMIGNCLAALVYFLLYHFVYIHQTPAILLLASVPIGLCGGGICLAIGATTYIMKTVSSKNRGMRLGILEGILLFSVSIGLYGGGQILKGRGYGVLFFTAFVIHFLAVLLALILIKNDKQNELPEHSKCCDIFNIGQVKETVSSIIRPRDGFARTLLLLLLLFSCINGLSLSGTGLLLPFTRLQYGWNQDDFTTFTIVNSSIVFLGLILASVIFIKYLKMPEIVVVGLSVLLFSATCLIISIGTWSGMMYIGAFLSCIYGIGGPLVRSIMSRFVPKDEFGKVNSCFALQGALITLIAGPISNAIYSETLSFFPGTVFVINGILALISIFVLGIFWHFYRQTNQYRNLDADELIVNN